MKHITIGKKRRDGKYPVRLVYDNGPNMFGGRNHPTVFNKLYTAAAIEDYKIYSEDTLVNNSGDSFNFVFDLRAEDNRK